jgi:hypothetical protein
MKPHYFQQDHSDADDHVLNMVKLQGYVPKTCLLGGLVAMAEVAKGDNPCWGCGGPREKCKGKPRQERQVSRGGYNQGI